MPLFRTLILTLSCALSCQPALAEETGEALAQRHIIIDGHIDVPYRLQEHWEDVTVATAKGEFDAPRARAGGLDIPFMSIYTPAELESKGGARELAHRLIDHVEALVGRAPESFVVVDTPDAARAAHAAGRIGLAMGMENGSPLEGELDNIARFRERGISYITLTHSLANHISDSSYDKERPNRGLSEFGRKVVREMNRQGVMVDVSHVSDDAFWQVLDISDVPVIASHSSARHFTPGFERNMSDDMIRALAEAGGVVMINFGSTFLTAEARAWRDAYGEQEKAFLAEHGFEDDGPESKQFQEDYRARHPFPYATLDDVLDHFDHVIALVGVEHVGVGSDYDGVGDSLPVGLKDVSTYPALVDGLLRRGHAPEAIEAVLGGNLLRVWEQVVARAERH